MEALRREDVLFWSEVRRGDRGLLFGEHLLRDLHDRLGVHVALHAQHHVGGGVEDPVAVVERFGGDVGDALHSPRNAVADGVVGIEHLQQIVVNRKAGIILAHADLLGDDALLLLHGLLGKVRGGDKVQQHAQVFLKALGALKVIAGDARGGEGVGVGPVCRQNVERAVAVRQVEHLVLQIMGHARRGVELAPIDRKAAAGPAVVCGKGGVEGGKILLRHHAYLQAVVENGGIQRLADAGVIKLLYLHLRLPLLRPRRCRTGSRPCRAPRSGLSP